MIRTVFRSLSQWSIALAGFFFLAACTAQYALNPKLDMKVRSNPLQSKLSSPDKSDELFFILAFSGGGTRAASLSYGILEALDRVEIPAPPTAAERKETGRPHTLLDEVDLITGVSGGSITAAYYGLNGRETFRDYREKVLLENLQAGLIRGVLNPVNWVRLWSPRFGRSDIAQEYYDEMIFHNATLGDLASGKGPAINILATDAIDGVVFPFVPGQFAQICSDFEKFPVSRAVAASAAFPGALTPVILKNYAGQCPYRTPAWVAGALADPDPESRTYHKAVMIQKYLDAESKPYIHLIDGGVADNLGVRNIVETIAAQGIRETMKDEQLSRTRKLVFIIVDAQVEEKPRWGLLDEIPGLGAILGSSSTIMINKYNFETIDLLRRTAQEWTYETAAAEKKPVEIYISHITFASLSDKSEREYFQSIPTALALPAEQVDKLRAVASRLLFSQKSFMKLIDDLGGKIKPEGGPGGS
jgi:NTE family protein